MGFLKPFLAILTWFPKTCSQKIKISSRKFEAYNKAKNLLTAIIKGTLGKGTFWGKGTFKGKETFFDKRAFLGERAFSGKRAF